MIKRLIIRDVRNMFYSVYTELFRFTHYYPQGVDAGTRQRIKTAVRNQVHALTRMTEIMNALGVAAYSTCVVVITHYDEGGKLGSERIKALLSGLAKTEGVYWYQFEDKIRYRSNRRMLLTTKKACIESALPTLHYARLSKWIKAPIWVFDLPIIRDELFTDTDFLVITSRTHFSLNQYHLSGFKPPIMQSYEEDRVLDFLGRMSLQNNFRYLIEYAARVPLTKLLAQEYLEDVFNTITEYERELQIG